MKLKAVCVIVLFFAVIVAGYGAPDRNTLTMQNLAGKWVSHPNAKMTVTYIFTKDGRQTVDFFGSTTDPQPPPWKYRISQGQIITTVVMPKMSPEALRYFNAHRPKHFKTVIVSDAAINGDTLSFFDPHHPNNPKAYMVFKRVK